MSNEAASIGGLEEMLGLIAVEHIGQVDKAGKPYVLHLLAVLEKVESDELVHQLIALGHDLLEQGKSGRAALEQVLAEKFGARVLQGIKNVTKDTGESPEAYEEKVLSSLDSMLAKKADLEHNMDLSRLPEPTPPDLQRHARYMQFHDRISKKLAELGHVSKPKAVMSMSLQGSPAEIGDSLFGHFAAPAFEIARTHMPPELLGLMYAGMVSAIAASMQSHFGENAERMLQDIFDLQKDLTFSNSKPTCH